MDKFWQTVTGGFEGDLRALWDFMQEAERKARAGMNYHKKEES